MGVTPCSCTATEALKIPSNRTTSEKACSSQSTLILCNHAALCSLLMELIRMRATDWRARDSELIAARCQCFRVLCGIHGKMVYLACDWSVAGGGSYVGNLQRLTLQRLHDNEVVRNSSVGKIINTRVSQQGDFCDLNSVVMSHLLTCHQCCLPAVCETPWRDPGSGQHQRGRRVRSHLVQR